MRFKLRGGTTTSRRRSLAVATIAALAALVAGCGGAPGGDTGSNSGGKGGTLKVGLLFPTSGNVAAAGTDMLHGWELYFKQHGDEVDGVKIDSIHEDSAGDPNTTLTKARKLVNQDGAKVLVGELLANDTYALANYIKTQTNIIGLDPSGSSDDLSQRKAVNNFVRAGGWQSSTPIHPAGVWAYKQGWRKVITLCNDYAFGYETCGGFTNTFTDMGGKVVKQLWSPLGTSDYSSYISQIPKNIDGVYVTMVGADAPKFLEAWKQLGYKNKVPLIANETSLEQSTLRGIKDDSPVGLQSFAHYAEGRDDPATQDFVKAYQKAYDEIPGYYSCATYTAAQWMAQAIKDVNGDTSDTSKFLDAIKSVQLPNSCEGPMKLDEHGGTIANVYMRKVVKQGNNLVNVVTKTYPSVSQFWHYKPDAFLSQPVYSRQYQGADWPTSCADYVSDCPAHLKGR